MGKTYGFDKAVDRRKTSCLKYDFGMERKGRDDLLPLWVADMDFQLPEEILADFRSRIDHGIFGYTDPDQEYFDALDHWFFTRHGYHVDRETVTVGCGVVYGLATGVKAFTKEGDAILIQQPVYYPFREVILPASGLWTRNTRTAWCCILHQAKPLAGKHHHPEPEAPESLPESKCGSGLQSGKHYGAGCRENRVYQRRAVGG